MCTVQFPRNLRTFALFLRMERNEFCAIFCAICAKPEYFLRKLRMKRNFSYAQFAQNRKFYTKKEFIVKNIKDLQYRDYNFGIS